MNRLIGFTLACLLVLVSSVATAQDSGGTPSQEELEKKLSEKLSGATLVGQFTVSDVNDGKPLRRTSTSSVRCISSRMAYGQSKPGSSTASTM